jgi:uncharacterized protein
MVRSTLGTTAVLVFLAVGASAQTPGAAPVVITQGEATVTRAPDQAWLAVATETRDPRADEARRKSAESMRAVEDALRRAGLPADAIKTTGFSLVPDMEWSNGRGTVKGYIVRNQIEARVDAIDRIGQVIDAANATRDSTLTISGPRFTLKDRQEAEAEALRQAVQSALGRAQAIAAGARKTVGAILRIEEQAVGGPARPQPFLMQAAGARAEPPTPVTPGDIDVHAQVTLTAELR